MSCSPYRVPIARLAAAQAALAGEGLNQHDKIRWELALHRAEKAQGADNLVADGRDRVGNIVGIHELGALMVDNTTLIIGDIVVLEQVLANIEVVRLDLALRALDLARQQATLDGLAFAHADARQQRLGLVGPGIGLDALETGIRMLPISITMFIAAALGSRLSSRFFIRTIVRAGLASVSIGVLLLLGTVDPTLNGAGFAVAMAVLGIGMIPPVRREVVATIANGAGLGAGHQTGWTGLVAELIQRFGSFV